MTARPVVLLRPAPSAPPPLPSRVPETAGPQRPSPPAESSPGDGRLRAPLPACRVESRRRPGPSALECDEKINYDDDDDERPAPPRLPSRVPETDGPQRPAPPRLPSRVPETDGPQRPSPPAESSPGDGRAPAPRPSPPAESSPGDGRTP